MVRPHDAVFRHRPLRFSPASISCLSRFHFFFLFLLLVLESRIYTRSASATAVSIVHLLHLLRRLLFSPLGHGPRGGVPSFTASVRPIAGPLPPFFASFAVVLYPS